MEATEKIYRGGEIYTVDDAHPRAEAVAVKNGRIAAVGRETACRSALGPDAEVIDLKGGALLPGFIDTHLHPPLMIVFEINPDLSSVTTLDALTAMIREKAATAEADEWILGLQFDEHMLRSPATIDRHALDAACADRPVLIVKRDGHAVIANTAAIEKSDISANTPDPEGGRIDREANGFPSGVFWETAMSLILGNLPFPDMEVILNAGRSTVRRLAQNGITSVAMILQTDEEGVAGPQGVFDVPLMEMLLDRIPINLYTLLVAGNVEKIKALRKTGLHHPDGVPGRRIGGLKFWADGTLKSCTAFTRQPFSDRPDQQGFLIHTPEKMYQRMEEAHRAGEQIAIHTIGDASTRVCLDLFHRLLQKCPRKNHRHRLEHASLLAPDLIADIARLGLVVTTQPMCIHSEKAWLPRRLGPDRTPWVYPYRSLLDAGVTVAGSSDAPIEALNVLRAIGCCVTREGFEPGQRITAEAAVRFYTINAAVAQFEETEKGSLSVGKRADMVILDRNPVSVAPGEIKDIQVQQTICGGHTIYENS